MKAYQLERAHGYESLITAATIGIFVGSVGVALNAVWFYRQTSWHVTATVQGLVQMLIVTVLVTLVLGAAMPTGESASPYSVCGRFAISMA